MCRVLSLSMLWYQSCIADKGQIILYCGTSAEIGLSVGKALSFYALNFRLANMIPAVNNSSMTERVHSYTLGTSHWKFSFLHERVGFILKRHRYTQIRTHTYVHIHTYTHIRTHTKVHTQIQTHTELLNVSNDVDVGEHMNLILLFNSFLSLS